MYPLNIADNMFRHRCTSSILIPMQAAEILRFLKKVLTVFPLFIVP
jgi:hypothetical protein